MISDYLIPIILGLFGGIGVVIVQIVYYEYTSSKENKGTFLKMQITDLLLPLYIQFHFFDNEMNAGRSLEEILNSDTEIQKIVANKLYLASPKLSSLLLEILSDQCLSRKGSYHALETLINQNYNELTYNIYKEYEEKREQYQKNVIGHRSFSDFLKYLRSG